jgi:hypothetical protein
MPRLSVEYTLCQIQSGQVSIAIKTHRREHGNPELEIEVQPDSVVFRLLNLFDGVPQAVLGTPRQDHVDLYFLLTDFRRDRTQFPTVTARPNRALLLPLVDPSGMERPGGKDVRMVNPICRLIASEARIESRRPPVFRAVAVDPQMFVDFEITPVRGYGQEMGEIHIGCNGEFGLVPSTGVTADVCEILMNHEVYATLRDALMRL